MQISSNGQEKEEKKKSYVSFKVNVLSAENMLKNTTSVPPLSFCTNSVLNNTFG